MCPYDGIETRSVTRRDVTLLHLYRCEIVAFETVICYYACIILTPTRGVRIRVEPSMLFTFPAVF